MLRRGVAVMSKVSHKHALGEYIPRLLKDAKGKPRRMFSIQADLPRLPVPALSQTMEKYLRVVRPLTDDEEFSNTKKLVEDFARTGSIGPQLQQALEERAKGMDSWLSQWWLEQAYLRYRDSVVINVNPGVVLPVQQYDGLEGQARWAAQLLAGALDYKILIDEQTLPVETLGGRPLCMIQYYKILSSCRIPRDVMDEVVCFPPDQANPPRHVCVVHNGHFFELPVYGADNRPLNRKQLFEALMGIMRASPSPAEHPVGVLTSQHRDVWSKQYAELEKDNPASMESVRRSILVLCLDSSLPQSAGEQRLNGVCSNLLHGAGVNSHNRWFDKTIQLIVTRDGGSGLCYEHAPAEGPPVMALVDHMFAHAMKEEVGSSASLEPASFTQLEFRVSPEVARGLEPAQESISKACADVNLGVLQFQDFGKNFPKSQKLSPDAFIQVAIQLAYFRLHGRSCASYESGSLRMFQLGRTDTIRGCSVASADFCRAMRGDASMQERAEKLRQAVLAHRAYSNETVTGQGIDRHLLGLRLIASEQKLATPELFTDHVYQRALHFNISTSQVPAKSECLLCFGPVVPDGYGICYNPQERQILFAVTTYNSNDETNTENMVNALNQSLKEMQELLLSQQKAKL